MIEFIKAKNFQSWESLPFDIEDGVTLIKGFNHDDQTDEGSGKSAIPNAMCWGIYGKLPKEAKIDEVIKDGAKGCLVEVQLKNGVKIVRSRNPNDLFILQDGNKIKGKDAKDTQKIIETLIGMSFDTFCQTVYFAQNYNKKFVTANQDDRGKILSEIQDLSIFDRAYKETHSVLKLNQQKLADFDHKKELQNMKLRHNKESIEEHRKFIQKQKVQKTVNLENLNRNLTEKINKIKELESKLQNHTILDPDVIKGYLKDITELESKVQEIQAEKARAEVKLSEVNNNLNSKSRLLNNLKSDALRIEKLESEKQKLLEFIKNPSQVCKSCGSTLKDCDTSHALKELENIDKQLDSLNQGILQIDSQISALNESLDVTVLNDQVIRFKVSINEINSVIYDLREKCRIQERSVQEYENIQSMINLCSSDVEKIEENIKKVESEVIDESPEVINVLLLENEQIEETLQSLENLKKDTNDRIIRLETLKHGFKEVKAYTFNSVLNELSRRTNGYLQELFEMPIKLEFTNENMKIGLDIKANGITRSHGLFSGGQQRRIGLAVDLALSDIVTSRTGHSLDLIVLDEYFKDLSETSMEKCLRLLEKLGRPTILIEHNTIFKNIVNRNFDIELRDGTSCLMT